MIFAPRVMLLAGLAFTFGAAAQTTRPAAEQPWPKAMGAFSKALLGGDIAAMEKVLAKGAKIYVFDSTTPQESWRLFERVNKSTLVGQHAYMHPPLVMAADVSADFKNAAGVPDRAKLKFMVEDEQEMKRGNATAAQWMGEQLSAKNGTPVGVVVLWTPKTATTRPSTGSNSPEYDVVFLLCKGEEVGPQKFRITSVVYGSPLAEQ